MTESQFTRSFDGTRIAYRTYGNGSPTILLSNGIGCNQVYLEYLIGDLEKHYRVVVWDYRGHVDSDTPTDLRNLTVDCCVQDVLAVMNAAEIDQAVVGGFSMGVQVSFEIYAQLTERVSGILALCGPYENPLRTFFYMGPLVNAVFPAFVSGVRRHRKLVQKVWRAVLSGPWVFPAAKLLVFNAKAVKRDDFERYRPHIANIDVVTFLQTAVYLSKHSAAGVLPRIEVPTLVVAGTKDNFTPLSVCRRMYEMIPGAEWFSVEDGSHGALIEFPEIIGNRVLQFLTRHFDGERR